MKQEAAECDGAQFCTVMAVYYNTHPECRKLKVYGKTHFEKNPGNDRDAYYTTHKNVCYQLSVVGRKDGEAVAAAIKKGI